MVTTMFLSLLIPVSHTTSTSEIFNDEKGVLNRAPFLIKTNPNVFRFW